MKISIITVCFNSEATIRDTIESVLAQKYSDIEYIIVDGKSTDKTMDIVREYQGRIAKIISEPDKGIYDAMNKGIEKATGDVIGILNSDDFYRTENSISEVVVEFQKSATTDMVLGGVDFVHEDELNHAVRYYKAIGFKPWKLRFGLMAPHPAAFIRREAYKKVGTYKLNYKISADFDFFVRALLVHELSFITVDKVWVRMRVGGVSTSGLQSYKVSTQEMLRSFKENERYTNFLFLLLRLPLKSLQLIKREKKKE
ncbi:glycosyltransferase family 2 protein [Advenella sp. RU8]|uniref:glycosyltransferase family 2 protein n=1 Tax=Advenella sp. RU8 TaxID=3399575 RepID=UPI003AADB97D